ncbi:MAG: DNA polymerase IV [Candidatus Hermodarchaeota archaeon]|nr:DNA polymerase IV [Candidatus Hermodarchaeota archaeon]
MPRWIMHIDMDAFYASVEQYRLHPEYIGHPLCVGPDPRQGKGRGVVRAASYEARAFGVRSAMPTQKAYELCPDAVFVFGDFSQYFEASEEVMAVIERFADNGRVRKASIDEAYIEVTNHVQEYSDPRTLAKELQDTIKAETQLPASIGIAPNMAVAKIATGENKPLGITLVPQEPDAVAQFLAPLHVMKVNGIGKVTARYLAKFGITTLGEIQQLSLKDLVPIMGKGAKWLYNRAWGIDNRDIVPSGPWRRKSMGKDRTFPRDIDSESSEVLYGTLEELCSRIGQKLQAKSYHFRTVTVKIRYQNYETVQRSRTLNVSTNEPEVLRKEAITLFEAHRKPEMRLRLVGVRVSNLTRMTGQASLADFF